MSWLRFLFSFEGRFNRLKFLGAFYAVGLVCAPFVILALHIDSPVLIWASSISQFVGLAAAGTKRLHDRNKSGWWLALYYGLPFIIGTLDHLAHGTSHPENNSPAAMIIIMPLMLWGMIELVFFPGTPGSNRFGPGWLTTEPKSFPSA